MNYNFEIELGLGIIDCAIASTAELIVAGDVSGLLSIVDLDGKQVTTRTYQMPIWGVDISSDGELIVIGLASKQDWTGAIIIERDGKEIFQYKTNAPVWDVVINDKTKTIACSTWGDGVIFINNNEVTRSFSNTESHYYGLSLIDPENDKYIATKGNQGCVSIILGQKEKTIISAPQSCYKNRIQDNKLFFGSSDGSLHLYDSNEKLFSNFPTPLSNICGIEIDSAHVFYGDLHGRILCATLRHPQFPISYNTVPGGIWSLRNLPGNKNLLIACGDGKLRSVGKESLISPNEKHHLALDDFKLSLIAGAKIFVSYASEDIDHASMLYNALRQLGMEPWMDKKDILPGQDWQRSIKKAIYDSDYLILCMSNNSVKKRGFVQREIRFALDILEGLPSDQIYLIPVRLDDCTVPEEVSRHQWVDLFSDDGLTKVLKAISVSRT